MTNILKITGKSGTTYKFSIYQLPHSFTVKRGAIYLFIKILHQSFHVPIYLGITDDLKELAMSHDEEKIINKNGATHICICIEKNKSKRQFAEKDLSEIAQTH